MSFLSGLGHVASDVGNGIVHGAEDVGNGIVHGAEDVGNGIKDGFTELIHGGANTAPTPTVNSTPPAPTQPSTWQAPSVDASGHIKVHHGALTDAADVIKKYVPELESVLAEISSHSGAFDSLMSWTTGSAVGGNLSAAVTAFHTAGKDTSQAHADTAGNLQGSAQSYSDAESTNAQTVAKVSSPGSAPSGSAPASGSSSTASSAGNGNWS